jgi:hypothetical protein
MKNAEGSAAVQLVMLLLPQAETLTRDTLFTLLVQSGVAEMSRNRNYWPAHTGEAYRSQLSIICTPSHFLPFLLELLDTQCA